MENTVIGKYIVSLLFIIYLIWTLVDHIVRLEYGGSNHVDNLVAMCRECHGKKTTMENL